MEEYFETETPSETSSGAETVVPPHEPVTRGKEYRFYLNRHPWNNDFAEILCSTCILPFFVPTGLEQFIHTCAHCTDQLWDDKHDLEILSDIFLAHYRDYFTPLFGLPCYMYDSTRES